jgi:hypothetical protein
MFKCEQYVPDCNPEWDDQINVKAWPPFGFSGTNSLPKYVQFILPYLCNKYGNVHILKIPCTKCQDFKILPQSCQNLPNSEEP